MRWECFPLTFCQLRRRKAVPSRRAAAQKSYKEVDSDDDNDAEGDTSSPEDEIAKKPVSRTKRDVLKENKATNSAATATSEYVATASSSTHTA